MNQSTMNVTLVSMKHQTFERNIESKKQRLEQQERERKSKT